MTFESKTFIRLGRWVVPAVLALASVSTACGGDGGEDEGTGGTGGSDGSGGNDGSGGSSGGSSNTGGGPNTGGGAGEGGMGAAPGAGERWLIGGWLSTDDAYTGYLTVVDDISASGSVDLGRVAEFPGDITWQATDEGVIYVGQDGLPTIERWVVSADNQLEMDAEVSLQEYGVTSTLGGGRNVIQIVDAEKAYYFDSENFQVVVFNPETMDPVDSFSIDGLDEEGEWPALNFVQRDGDRFVISARYWSLDDDTSTSLVRAAFIDSTDDSVTYAEDTRCGNVGFAVKDQNGNLYLGAHHGLAVGRAAGLEGEDPTESCILRINAGESEFDQNYYVDLTEVSDGGVVGGLQQGPGNTAYVYSYEGEAITAETYNAALRGEDWELYAIELGDDDTDFVPVDGLGRYAPYGGSFETIVNGESIPFLTLVDADFASGQYFDLSEGTSARPALEFPGYPGPATRLP